MATVSVASGIGVTPSSAAVASTANYVGSATLLASSVGTAANVPLHKRDVDEQLIKRYGDQGITGLMELLGSKKETTQQTFEHFEETHLHNTFTGCI